MNFLDEKDGPDQRDEIDLLTKSEDGRGRAWTGPILSNLRSPRKKDALTYSIARLCCEKWPKAKKGAKIR
jgi:hypothetical protein